MLREKKGEKKKKAQRKEKGSDNQQRTVAIQRLEVVPWIIIVDALPAVRPVTVEGQP